jgi:hypothetical protein
MAATNYSAMNGSMDMVSTMYFLGSNFFVPVAIFQLSVWRRLFSKMEECVMDYTEKGYSTLYQKF